MLNFMVKRHGVPPGGHKGIFRTFKIFIYLKYLKGHVYLSSRPIFKGSSKIEWAEYPPAALSPPPLPPAYRLRLANPSTYHDILM